MTSSGSPRHRTRRRVWLWAFLGSGVFLLIALLAIASWVPFSSDTLRARVVATLADRLDAEVELEDLQLRVFPRFHAEGIGLTIRHKGRHDVPPLISIKTLSVDADVIGLLRKHIAAITLNGLEIEIPPDRHDQAADLGAPEVAPPGGTLPGSDVIFDHLRTTDARLVIIPSKAGKTPRVWDIHALDMRGVGFDRAMPFDATLTNAVPPGEIATKGSFGPWQRDDPGAAPLEGTFAFAHADLGVFKGISGILSAHGEFGGQLGRLGIHGETDTPDFTLSVSGHPVPLHTDYHATVDGTNGDTLLDRVDARLLETSLSAKGGIIDGPAEEGRTVTIDVEIPKGRLEDVILLAVKAQTPPMSGTLTLKAKLVLPPGHRDVVDKLRLEGDFRIATARFASINIQLKINELSQRSLGRQRGDNAPSVVSNFKGHFRLADARMTLRDLAFDVPGAGVRLGGTYALRSEQLDFTGVLLMDAKISDTQTGVKRLLLKAIDPLFRRNGGGSSVPIRIAGKRSDPSFGLDRSRVFHRGN